MAVDNRSGDAAVYGPSLHGSGTHDLAAAGALATRCSVEEIAEELPRFEGYRGIVQARALLPIVDPRSGSQFESISRRPWHQAGLPHPECQVPVPAPDGG